MDDNQRREIEELRQATREAHEILKDLTRARRETEKLLASIPRRVEDEIGEAVRKGLEGYHDVIRKAMDAATEKVFAEFRKLEKAFLGDGKRRPSLIKLAKDVDSAGIVRAGGVAE